MLLKQIKIFKLDASCRIMFIYTARSREVTYVKNNICSIAQRQTCLHAAPVKHLNPTVCFFCNRSKVYILMGIDYRVRRERIELKYLKNQFLNQQ